MLPVPSTAYRSKPRPSQSYFLTGPNVIPKSALVDRLRNRTRLTNLAVALIAGALCLSLLFNMTHWASEGRIGGSSSTIWNVESRQQVAAAESIQSTIQRSPEMTSLNHLVMVAGHAIWIGSDPLQRQNDDDWILSPIQKGGSVETFYRHIATGIQLAKEDSKSLLIFSGGQTRADTSPTTTESQSYLRLALATGLLPPPDQFTRVTTEEFALDSYTNLLFSYARFHEMTGRWPEKVTVVGFGMKRARFENLHRLALRIPLEDFNYVGIDDAGDTSASYQGEFKHGFQPFSEDLYGCHPPLSIKKQTRNPYARYHPYHTSSPEIRGLLEWCPATKVRLSVLPVFGSAVQPVEGTENLPRIDDVAVDGLYPGPVPWATNQVVVAEGGWSREED